jgi:N-succinyldiaminopimelate aminotransferase
MFDGFEDSIVAHGNLARDANAVDLCSGTWPGAPVDWVGAAATQTAGQAIAFYPDARGSSALRAAVAYHYRDGRVSPTNVTVAAGATSALLVALAAMTHPGDTVVTIEPGYTLNGFTIERMGLAIRPVPAWSAPTDVSGWRLDVARVVAAMSRAAALVVVDPSNPTGSVLSKTDWQGLIDAARRTGCRVITDRVYEAYALDAAPVATGWLLAEGVVVLSSMTKAFHAPGLRIGWILAESALGPTLERATSLLLGGVAAPAQAIAAAALTCMPAGHLAREAERARTLHRALASALAAAGIDAWPADGGLFLCVPARALGTGDSVQAWRRLLKLGIGGVPSSAFRSSPEPESDAFVRLTFARDFETIAQVRARFQRHGCGSKKEYSDDARSA